MATHRARVERLEALTEAQEAALDGEIEARLQAALSCGVLAYDDNTGRYSGRSASWQEIADVLNDGYSCMCPGVLPTGPGRTETCPTCGRMKPYLVA